MGASKSDHFTPIQNQMAGIAKAIAHPARIAIVQHLLQAKACICGDIVNQLPLAQPTVSQHLKELKNAGIIQGNIEGNAICYCLNPDTFQLLETFVSGICTQLSEQKNTCC